VFEPTEDASQPHVSWEIRGGRGGENDVVCDSGRDRGSCVLLASRERRVPVTVHVSFHAARELTNYLGVVETPFLQGTGSRDVSEVSLGVPPGSAPVSKAVTSFVTQTAGSYALTITLDAVQGTAVPQRIHEEVPVVVK